MSHTDYLNIKQAVADIQAKLYQCTENEFIADSYVPPFCGGDDIKLIIIGQDPTIRNEAKRFMVKCTLNLDHPNGALYRYVERICFGLGLSVKNVYATNLFKYMYKMPPSKTIEVLQKHLQENLCLLNEELSEFPRIPIITLGEPVLKLLVGRNAKVREYWGYKKGIPMHSVDESCLNRPFYPFPHQPSMRKEFYKNTIGDYTGYMRNNGF